MQPPGETNGIACIESESERRTTDELIGGSEMIGHANELRNTGMFASASASVSERKGEKAADKQSHIKGSASALRGPCQAHRQAESMRAMAANWDDCENETGTVTNIRT